MNYLRQFSYIFLLSSLLFSCGPADDEDGCDTENDCMTLNVDGEPFLSNSTSASITSLLGNSTINIQGKTDVSTSDILAINMIIVDPVVGNISINLQNASQKSIVYYNESGEEFQLIDGAFSIAQFNTEEILVEGNFSGTARSSTNESIMLTNGYFIVNQPE